jgi:2-keto-4-pentenoate hydratase/2-oxohepta-3-ene-1,7-dioic acid hydratase in catechol pathway
MKFLRYGPLGQEKPGFLDAEGQIRDLSGQVPDLSGDVLTRLGSITPDGPVVDGNPRLGAPVAGTGKMVCIGRNYADHAAETGADLPPEPMIFMKATSAIQGPNDPIEIPRGATEVDWEVELAIVIGRPAKYVTEADALSHVAGYLAANDVSERAFQKKRAGQFTKGKSCDTFGPLGPWLVTPDEVPDPQDLPLNLWVNGDLRQHDSTANMIFGVAHLISYLSGFFTLHTGDIIATGTPSGVGLGMTPPQFLRPGDRIALEIGPLGRQEADIVAG